MKLVAKLSLLSSLAAFTAICATQANAATLYKWVDSDGNISYQDQPPPEDAKLLEEREVKGSGAPLPGKVNNLPVVVYTVENCPNCEGAVLHLKKSGIPHIERALKDDRVAQSKILQTSNSITAPVIFIGNKILQSPGPQELTDQLKKAGYNIDDVPTKSSQ